MKKNRNEILEKMFPFICITVVCFILTSPLLSSKYIWGHDSFFHISNIEALSSTILNGNWFFPKIYPIIANDFGYASGIFYGQLPHFITAILNLGINVFTDLSVLNVMKIVHFFNLFFSAAFMYVFIKKVTNKKVISIVGAIIYITFPYRMSEIFVRDAYAESMTFVFLPLIFYGLHELLYGKNNRSFYIPFILGTSALVITHTITTLYAAMIVAIYLLLNFKKLFKKEIIKKLCISIIFILCLTSFYTVPLLEQKFYTDTFIFTNHDLLNSSNVSAYSLSLSKLFPFAENASIDGIVFYITVPIIMLLIFSLFEYRNIKINNKEIFLQFFLLGSICLIMSTNLFPWKQMPSIFLYLQFPWRLLLFSIFFYSLFSVLILVSLKDYLVKPICYTLLIIIISACMYSLNLERVIEYSENQVDVSTYGVGAIKDYFPKKVVENYEYYENRSKDLIVTSGKGEVRLNYIDSSFANYEVIIYEEPLILEFPMLYYYGYTSYCGSTPNEPFEVRESKNGFVEVVIDKNCGATLNFTGSKLTQTAYNLTLFSLFLFLTFITREGLYEKRN